MLPSQHAAFSALATLVAAPLVRDKKNLALFWVTSVGEDVDHYLWYARRFRNPSLSDAYAFFRARYGQSEGDSDLGSDHRIFHGPLPLAVAVGMMLIEPRLRPVVVALAFHGLLDALNEYILMPARQARVRDQLPIMVGTRTGERAEDKAA